jgi:Dolichyl-phosphate-mannose-protein mannosyltransferase
MLLRGDWVTLHVNGVRYLEKAPLIYWAVAISYRVFGVNQFAVRFPTALAVVLLTLMTYLFGLFAFGEKAGLYAGVAIAFCIGVFLFTRFMIPEAILALWLLSAHYCFMRAFFGDSSDKRWYYGCYAAMALAVLTKGLIGIVFIAGPAGLFILLTRSWGELKKMRLLSGIVLFLLVAAPWHILAGLRNDHFFWFYFVNEHFLRFIGKRYPADYNRVPFLSYWLLHLVWLFPWSIGFPLVGASRPGFKRQSSMVSLYLWLWAGLILIFFNISTSQEYYTFPSYPALALLLGTSFASAEERPRARRYLLWAQAVLAAVCLAAGCLLVLLVWRTRHLPSTGDLSAVLNLDPSSGERYTLSMGHFFDLTPHAFAILRLPALGAATALIAGFVLALVFRMRNRFGAAAAAMCIAMGLLFVCANRALAEFEPVLSSRPLADEIERRWESGARIVIDGEYESGSSIGFYSNQQLLLLNGRVTGMEFGSHYPDAPPVFIEMEDLRRLWAGAKRIFLLVPDEDRERIVRELGQPVYVAAQRGGKLILMNRP